MRSMAQWALYHFRYNPVYSYSHAVDGDLWCSKIHITIM